jgi:hypothetical protein
MTTRYLTLWSLKSALHHSATLIRMDSHLRIAGLAMPEEGVGKTIKIAVDSDKCSCAGQGKVIFGMLIGTPVV